MNAIDEENSQESQIDSVSEENEKAGCLFDINEEIYELLLRNMVTGFDENEQVKVEFANTKPVKAGVPKANLKLQERPLYTQTIIVNPKKVHKKACLIYLDDFKKNDQMSLDFQFNNQIRDINIAKIWIQASKSRPNRFNYFI